MDRLSEMILSLRANAVITGRFTFRAPWSYRKARLSGVLFRICQGAPYFIRLADGDPVRVQPGDVVMFPQGVEHIISSDPNFPATPFEDVLSERGIVPQFDSTLVIKAGGGGKPTILHTAVAAFPEADRNPLFAALPPFIHIRVSDPSIPPSFRTTIQNFIEESMACQPGWAAATARLSEVLFIQVVRMYLMDQTGAHGAWLKGLLDPQIGRTMLAVQREPAAPWDLSALAALAGMSRSRYSARFVELVGQSPMAHVKDMRMNIAASELAASAERVTTVAEMVGYKSEKAFSRAFKQWSGVAPTTYARRPSTPMT